MDYAILHAATRVVRRVTTDPNPECGPDEIVFPYEGRLDLSGPHKCISPEGVISEAKAKEIEEARVDSAVESARREKLVKHLDEVINALAEDRSVHPRLQEYFTVLKALRT